MNLIISQYLKILKERNEFDLLLPDLLLAMKITSLSKPQTGTRQLGIDLPTIGIDPEDGQKKLFLFIIKYGDIGRLEWDSVPQSVRQSLNEAIDCFTNSRIPSSYKNLKRKIIVCTTGDLKEETSPNWTGYVTNNSSDSLEFSFWNGDLIATYIEKYMLDEHVFRQEDRSDLRRALALAGENDYSIHDLYKLFLRQLSIDKDGNLIKKNKFSKKKFIKSLYIINLATRIFVTWATDEGNTKHALIASERALLWVWHRINLEEECIKDKEIINIFNTILITYQEAAKCFFQKLEVYYRIQDGMSGYTAENSVFSLVVFEHIGILASIGLSQLFCKGNEAQKRISLENANIISQALCDLVFNNPVSASPRLDENIIDITIAIIFLFETNRMKELNLWLTSLVQRIDFVFRFKRNFPICSDSIDDLIELECFPSDEVKNRLMAMSWLLPTLAYWSVILEREDLYNIIIKGVNTAYSEVCMQLWHPDQDIFKWLYYKTAHSYCGSTEAPIHLPTSIEDLKKRMLMFNDVKRYNIIDISPGFRSAIPHIDFIAYRHFRNPIPPFIGYKFLNSGKK